MKRLASIFGLLLLMAVCAPCALGTGEIYDGYSILDGVSGGGGGSVLYPPQSTLLQWLNGSSPTTATARVGSDAVVGGVNCLDFDGVSQKCLANTTGLGLGDFYYRFGIIFEYEAGDYLFGDGDTTSNQWSSLFYNANGLSFGIDAGTKIDVEILADANVTDGDVLDIKVWRTSGVMYWSVVNKTTGLTHLGNKSEARDFSGGVGLSFGAAHTSSLILVLPSTVTFWKFQAGTTVDNIIREYTFEEGSDLPFDISGNGNHATANTATWTTADGIPSTNLDDGFYVATQGVAPYIPALADGLGLAANGLAITNPGGYPHNDGGYSLSNSGNSLSNNTFWVTDATYSALINHTNGSDYVVVKKNDDSMVTDVLTYSTNGWTVGEWTILDLWLNTPTDQGLSMEIAYDLDGTPIIDEDGSVLLELPE